MMKASVVVLPQEKDERNVDEEIGRSIWRYVILNKKGIAATRRIGSH